MPRIYDTMTFPSYVFAEYPKMLYNAKGQTRIAQDEIEEKALADEWKTREQWVEAKKK